jgi:hypothetical protein
MTISIILFPYPFHDDLRARSMLFQDGEGEGAWLFRRSAIKDPLATKCMKASLCRLLDIFGLYRRIVNFISTRGIADRPFALLSSSRLSQ